MRIGIVLLDKNTGENLLKTKVFTAEDVKVTLADTGKPFNSWRIVTTSSFPVEGLLEFSVFHGKAAEYGYKIELKNMETINLSYLIKEEKTNDPCKIYYYPMSDLKVLNRDFEYLKYNDRTFPNVVVIKLDRK